MGIGDEGPNRRECGSRGRATCARAETAMLCGAAWGAHVVELYAILESSVALQVPDLPDVKIVAAEFRDHQSVAYLRWPVALERALLPGDVVTLRP